MSAWSAHCRVVCAVGPESTGKTTLCQALAARYGLPWLPEYAREHLAGRTSYDAGDVAAIAREQARRERLLLAASPDGAILDTDLAVIKVWWRERFGPVPEWIETAFRGQVPRLYLLCRPDLPWQPDPLRESRGDLWRLHGEYRRLLAAHGLPFAPVAGRGEARTESAMAAMKRWGMPSVSVPSSPPAGSPPPAP